MPAGRGRARRELGQNFLVDPAMTRRIVHELDLSHSNRIVELGAGDGALTRRLAATGLPVTAIELDPHWAAVLRRRLPQVRVIRCDMREFRFPREEYALVGNLPYGITTTMTRRLLAESRWSHAMLLVQFSVARKRAEGGSMLNAQWAPWYRFDLRGRVPAASFDPVPSVDGGLLRIKRREQPLLPTHVVHRYQRFVTSVYTGKGRGVAGILRNLTRRPVTGISPASLPSDLTPADWASLYTRFASQ